MAPKKGRMSYEKKVSFGGALGKPFVDLFFKLECTRNKKGTTIFLVLNQADWGVKACSTNQWYRGSSCLGSFINSLVIEVVPKSWTSKDCLNLLLKPSTTSENFIKQNCSNKCFLLGKDPSISFQVGNNISINGQTSCWTASRSHTVSDSILWSWKVSRYADASKIKFSSIGYELGSMPPLGFDHRHMQYAPGFLEASASWHLPLDQDIEKLEFDLNLYGSTIIFQKHRRWHSIKEGPEFLLKEAFKLGFGRKANSISRKGAQAQLSK